MSKLVSVEGRSFGDVIRDLLNPEHGHVEAVQDCLLWKVSSGTSPPKEDPNDLYGAAIPGLSILGGDWSRMHRNVAFLHDPVHGPNIEDESYDAAVKDYINPLGSNDARTSRVDARHRRRDGGTCLSKLCVKPDHLLVGNPRDNVLDGKEWVAKAERIKAEQRERQRQHQVAVKSYFRLIRAAALIANGTPVREAAGAVGFSTERPLLRLIERLVQETDHGGSLDSAQRLGRVLLMDWDRREDPNLNLDLGGL